MTTELLDTFLIRELGRLGARLNQLEAWAYDFSGRCEHADCPIFGEDCYAQADRSPEGQDGATRLDRNDESAVGNADAPRED